MAETTLKSALCLMTIFCAVKGQAQIRESDYFVRDDFYTEFAKLTPSQFTDKTHDFSMMSAFANLISPEALTPDFIANIQKLTGDYRIFDLCAARDENRRNDVALSLINGTSIPGDVLGAIALCAPSALLRTQALGLLENRGDLPLISIITAVCPYDETRTMAFSIFHSNYLAQRTKMFGREGYLPLSVQQKALGSYFESLGLIAAISPNATQREIALNIIFNGQYSIDTLTTTIPTPIFTDGLRSYLMHTTDLVKGKQAFETLLKHESTTLQDVIEIFVFHKGSVEFYNQMIQWVVLPENQETLQRLIPDSEISSFDTPENAAEARAFIKFAKKMLFPNISDARTQSANPSDKSEISAQVAPSTATDETKSSDQSTPQNTRKDEL